MYRNIQINIKVCNLKQNETCNKSIAHKRIKIYVYWDYKRQLK